MELVVLIMALRFKLSQNAQWAHNKLPMTESQSSKGDDKLLVSISGNWKIWQNIHEQFLQNDYLPFGGFLWKFNQQDAQEKEETLNINKLQAEFLEENSPLFDPLAEALNWWRKPFLYIFVFEYDVHKDSQHDLINRLRQWINRRSAVSGECLLLCVNREELNGSKGSGSVGLRFMSPTSASSGARKFVEKLRTELKVFVASVSGLLDQSSDDLQSAFHKIRDTLLSSAVSRIQDYQQLMQSQHSNDIYRQLVIRESIALIYLAMGVREEALKQYQECEGCLGLNSSDGDEHVPSALRVYKYDFEGSDLENPLDRSHRPYRLLISQGDISLHSLQLYFLGRDVELNLAMSQPVQAGERGVKLVKRILERCLSPWIEPGAARDRLKESHLSPLFIASLAINVCLHMASTFLAIQADGAVNVSYHSREKALNCIISEFLLIARRYSMGILGTLQDLEFDGTLNADEEEEEASSSRDSPLLDDFPQIFAVSRNGYFTRGSSLLNTLHPSLRRRTPKTSSPLHLEGKERNNEGMVSPQHQVDTVEVETSIFEDVFKLSLSLDDFLAMLNPKDSRRRISGRLLAALSRRGGVADLCHDLTVASCAFLERAARLRMCTILQYETALAMRRSRKLEVASSLLRRCLLFLLVDNWNILLPPVYHELGECLEQLQMVRLRASLSLVLLGAKGITRKDRKRAEEHLKGLSREPAMLRDVAFSSDSLLSAQLVHVENCRSSSLSDTPDLMPQSSSQREELNDVVTLDLGDGLIVTSKRVREEEAEEERGHRFGETTREESEKSVLFEVALGQEFNLDVEVTSSAIDPLAIDEMYAVMDVIQDEHHPDGEGTQLRDPPSSSSSTPLSSSSLLLPDINRPASMLFEDLDGSNVILPSGSMVFPMLSRSREANASCFRSNGAVTLKGGKNRVMLTGSFQSEGCYRISCFVFLLGHLRLAHKSASNEIFFVRLFPPPAELSVWSSGSITKGHEPIVRIQIAAKKMEVARSQLTVQLPDQLSLGPLCLLSVFDEAPEEEQVNSRRFNELCAKRGEEVRWSSSRAIEIPTLGAGQAAFVLFGLKVGEGGQVGSSSSSSSPSPSSSSGSSRTVTVRLASSVERNRFFRVERELRLEEEEAFTVNSRLQWRSEEEKILLLLLTCNIPIHSCCLLSHHLAVPSGLQASPASRHVTQPTCMARGDVVSLVYSITRSSAEQDAGEEAEARLEINFDVEHEHEHEHEQVQEQEQEGIYKRLHGKQERSRLTWQAMVRMGAWDRPSLRYSFAAGQTCVFGEPHEVELQLEVCWGRHELGRELLCELVARDGSWFLVGRTKFRVAVPVRREGDSSPPPPTRFRFRLLPLYCGNLSLPALVISNVPAAALHNASASSSIHVLPRDGTRVMCELFPVPSEAADGGKLQLRRKEVGQKGGR
ncbi:hypothetical protein GUITHDRAFT_110253 [Guillardia theta CCMP2712]|uniref:TRAPPC10/Trs130 N-terminal domain-containing protein n=2 Tax=Guillardia theta TaxID=55529 RepID=L1J6T7_GUITC|nr:hypothetical protein GUITHDRAFT_110253 [Guillardia theta CCMP2712]EKX43799.1 hypothetical protein GUITHDRAFT_110253 [Guillardia theta CCMP2712]|eukprot:XP_005830779.1 hypothetical protein GUITHDRAFT_110253 [Guillardia theta CCMP2712]